MSVTVERRYQMIRVAAGDYLLPSNDARSLWRIYSYIEDGSGEWGPDANGKYTPILGKFWACARYERPFTSFDVLDDHDFLDWGLWLTWATTHRSRREAVDAALTAAMREP